MPNRAARIGLALGLAALGPALSAERGLLFTHRGHDAVQELECTDCHGMKPAERSLPNHQVCSICHDTEPAAEGSGECARCHQRPDHAVGAAAQTLPAEIRFDHESHRERSCTDCHATSEEIEKRVVDPAQQGAAPVMPTCALCHPDPDAARFVADPAKPFCVGCHEQMGPSRTECAICHRDQPGAASPSVGL